MSLCAALFHSMDPAFLLSDRESPRDGSEFLSSCHKVQCQQILTITANFKLSKSKVLGIQDSLLAYVLQTVKTWSVRCWSWTQPGGSVWPRSSSTAGCSQTRRPPTRPSAIPWPSTTQTWGTTMSLCWASWTRWASTGRELSRWLITKNRLICCQFWKVKIHKLQIQEIYILNVKYVKI